MFSVVGSLRLTLGSMLFNPNSELGPLGYVEPPICQGTMNSLVFRVIPRLERQAQSFRLIMAVCLVQVDHYCKHSNSCKI